MLLIPFGGMNIQKDNKDQDKLAMGKKHQFQQQLSPRGGGSGISIGVGGERGGGMNDTLLSPRYQNVTGGNTGGGGGGNNHPTSSSGMININKYTAKDLANQITLITQELFRSIELKEFLNRNWKSDNKEKLAKGIVKMIQFSNRVSQYFLESVLLNKKLASSKRKSIKIFHKVIEIGNLCFDYCNFDTFMIIYSCVHSVRFESELKIIEMEIAENSQYSQVNKSYQALNEHYHWMMSKSKFIYRQKLNMLIESENEENENQMENNMYRKITNVAVSPRGGAGSNHQSGTNQPVIPFLGIHLTDLFTIEEANSDFIRENPSNVKKEDPIEDLKMSMGSVSKKINENIMNKKVINFVKCQLIGNTIELIHKLQNCQNYTFPKINDVYFFFFQLSWNENTQSQNKNENYLDFENIESQKAIKIAENQIALINNQCSDLIQFNQLSILSTSKKQHHQNVTDHLHVSTNNQPVSEDDYYNLLNEYTIERSNMWLDWCNKVEKEENKVIYKSKDGCHYSYLHILLQSNAIENSIYSLFLFPIHSTVEKNLFIRLLSNALLPEISIPLLLQFIDFFNEYHLFLPNSISSVSNQLNNQKSQSPTHPFSFTLDAHAPFPSDDPLSALLSKSEKDKSSTLSSLSLESITSNDSSFSNDSLSYLNNPHYYLNLFIDFICLLKNLHPILPKSFKLIHEIKKNKCKKQGKSRNKNAPLPATPAAFPSPAGNTSLLATTNTQDSNNALSVDPAKKHHKRKTVHAVQYQSSTTAPSITIPSTSSPSHSKDKARITRRKLNTFAVQLMNELHIFSISSYQLYTYSFLFKPSLKDPFAPSKLLDFIHHSILHIETINTTPWPHSPSPTPFSLPSSSPSSSPNHPSTPFSPSSISTLSLQDEEQQLLHRNRILANQLLQIQSQIDAENNEYPSSDLLSQKLTLEQMNDAMSELQLKINSIDNALTVYDKIVSRSVFPNLNELHNKFLFNLHTLFNYIESAIVSLDKLFNYLNTILNDVSLFSTRYGPSVVHAIQTNYAHSKLAFLTSYPEVQFAFHVFSGLQYELNCIKPTIGSFICLSSS